MMAPAMSGGTAFPDLQELSVRLAAEDEPTRVALQRSGLDDPHRRQPSHLLRPALLVIVGAGCVTRRSPRRDASHPPVP